VTKKHRKNSQQHPTPENYIRNRARKLPIYECMISDTWREEGIGNIIIARKHVTGYFTVGFYLTDLYCLGVKDTMFYFNISSIDYRETIKKFNSDDNLIPCKYSLAHNIIWGAVDYAESFGIHPHKDFTNTTQYILEEDNDDIEWIDIEFGKDGKPTLIMENEQEALKYIKQLEKKADPGNYEFILTDDFYEHLDILDEYLEDEEDEELFPIDEEVPDDMKEELNQINKWNDKEWEEYSKGKRKISDKALGYFTDRFFYNMFSPGEIQRTQDEVDKMMAIELTTLELSELPEYDQYYKDEELNNEIYDIEQMNPHTKSRHMIIALKRLIKQHPQDPRLYIDLAMIYEEHHKNRKADDIKIYAYNRFPRNLFVLTNYLAYLIDHKKLDELGKVLENRWSLAEIFPERRSFHHDEILNFYGIITLYNIVRGDLLKAEFLLKSLLDLDIETESDDVILDEISCVLQLMKIKATIKYLKNRGY